MTKETKRTATSDHIDAKPEKTYALPSAFDLFTPSGNIIRNNLPAFLILAGIPALLIAIAQSRRVDVQHGAHSFHAVFSSYYNGHNPWMLIAVLIGMLAAPGIIYLQLQGVRNKTPDYREAFLKGLHYFWRFLGTGILAGLMLAISFILLVVPFFILLPRVILSVYYLVDRDLRPIEAIKASMADYKKYKGTWGVLGVNILIGVIAAIPVLGWIISAVVGFLYRPALAIRYEQIKEMSEDKPPRTPIEVASIVD